MTGTEFNQDEITERIFLTRKRSGLSQLEFAKRLGISPRGYRNYELGERQPPLSLIVAIHREFGKSIPWLISGEIPATIEELFAHLSKAKKFARQHIEQSGKSYSSHEQTVIEAKLLSQLITHGELAQAAIESFIEHPLS